MGIADELGRIAAHAASHAREGETVAGVLATEPAAGRRVYLCALEGVAARGWIALDGDGRPLTSRTEVRDAVSVAALCEVAEESAAGGDLDELLRQLVALRSSEAPEGIDEAEAAARELRSTIGSPPQLATPARLDEIGAAVRRLERALDPAASSPFAATMAAAGGAVERLAREIEETYRGRLE